MEVQPTPTARELGIETVLLAGTVEQRIND